MILGITGGVGAGKSTILNILQNEYNYKVYEADKIGHLIMKKGTQIYDAFVKRFGEKIIGSDGEIDRKEFAKIIFADAENLDYVDSLIHPGVLHYILDDIKETEENGASLYAGYVIEAALLLEAAYDRVCDKVWYIYVDENTRRKRLKESRGYSDEKIDSIMKNQLSDEEFESKCDYKIDNSFDIDHTRACIKKALEF